jgi:hypothetical protein
MEAGFDSITLQVEIVVDTVALCQVFLLVQSLLYLSGLIGTASHPYMQKIRIIGFFFENRLLWQFEVEENFYKRLV